MDRSDESVRGRVVHHRLVRPARLVAQARARRERRRNRHAGNVGIGSSAVLNRLSMLFASVESLRSLARIQPFWTNVSFPSGRTSLIVASRSTSGLVDRTQRLTAPLPMTVVFEARAGETYE